MPESYRSLALPGEIQVVTSAADDAFYPAGTGAVARTVESKLRDVGSVEDFGAVGDGTTDDSAAFLAMLGATGGIVRILDKQYKVNQLNLTSYSKVAIVGVRQPQPNSERTLLQNGSVIIGGLNIEANDVHFENFGLDFGTARTVTATDGIVANAKPSQIGNFAYVNNVSSLGKGGAFLTHGILLQGYDSNTIRNVFSGKHGYGVVLKGRQGIISDIRIETAIQAGVFLKGDNGAAAANVADGSCRKVVINNVICMADSANNTCNGVWVQSPSANAGQALISNVFQSSGKAPVFVSSQGAAGPIAANLVLIDNVMSEYASYGLLIGGVTNNVFANNIHATNPTTGKLVQTDLYTTNYSLNNLGLFINDAGITGLDCLELYGIGMFDNLAVNNTVQSSRVKIAAGSLPSIKTGNVSGNVFIENEGNLSGINGAVVDATDPARAEILPHSVVKLSGRFDLTSSTNKFFCNLPFLTGKQMTFACGGLDSGGAHVTTAVRLNNFQLSIEPSLPAGFRRVDLSNIVIPL